MKKHFYTAISVYIVSVCVWVHDFTVIDGVFIVDIKLINETESTGVVQ